MHPPPSARTSDPPSALLDRLFAPIDIAPLIFFRIVAGTLMTIETVGMVLLVYRGPLLETSMSFSYLLLPWWGPWPAIGIWVHFAFNVTMAACIALGFHYRVAASLFFVGSTSFLLMDRTLFINHIYLYSLLGLLLAAIPAHRAISLDARRSEEIRASWAPAWSLYLLRFQLGVVYVYAAIAKMHGDWIEGLPMHQWLGARSDMFGVGPLFALPATAVAMSWGGLLFDLLVVPGLLWHRTRVPTFVVATGFHVTNAAIFGLGTFPWFSIAMSALFFPPETFRRLWGLRHRLPALAPPRLSAPGLSLARLSTARKAGLALFGVYAAAQLAAPTAHFFYPGDTSWTEEGHQFAWRMMLRTKEGTVRFVITNPETGQEWREDPWGTVSPRQYRKLAGNPDMILQYAHAIAERFEEARLGPVEVRAISSLRMNGRPAQPLVDPTVDLAAQSRTLAPYDWILPLAPRESDTSSSE